MLEGLNKVQRQAVEVVDGPVMVFAGAGSGKTRTLTHRIAYMIEVKKINPSKILALTFTNKAANEMKERINNMIGPKGSLTLITTFHSLCARILRREIMALGYNKDYTILDEDEQSKVISGILERIDGNKRRAKFLQKEISRLKCFEIKSNDPFVNKVYNLYEDELKRNNALDFEDLLIKTKELFLLNSEVLEKYRHNFEYILVDEFQDTSITQYQIIKLLSLKHRNLFVVGDDDQSIYSFRGANYENIRLFKKDFSEYVSFKLEENYRSPQSILDCTNELISNNSDREKKSLFSSSKGEENDVEYFVLDDEKKEAEYVYNQIYSLKNSKNSYSDFAVLYRASSILRNFELEFVKRGIPYKIYGGVSYLRRKEIKDIIAYLKLIINSDDNYSFNRIINVPNRGIGNATIKSLIEISDTMNISLFKAIDFIGNNIASKKRDSLIEFKELISYLQEQVEENNLIDFFDVLLEKTEYLEYLKDEEEFEDRKANIYEFKSILLQIDEESDASNSEKLSDAFDKAILSDEFLQKPDQNKDGVVLSTIHSVKGLEFDYVFVVAFENNIFPNTQSILENDLEEERRIAYVGCTRAKKRLFLTTAKRRTLYGGSFSNEPSIFLEELLHSRFSKVEVKKEKYLKEAYYKKEEKKEVIEKVNNDPNIFNLGDKVIHDKFGTGIIIAIEKSSIASIFFDDTNDMKKILLTHPAIKKL